MTRIALVTTGGTIVSRIDEQTGLAMPVLSGAELVRTLQGQTDTDDLEVIDYIRVASPQIAPHHWSGLHGKIQALVERDDIRGVVVTHGTSTLEETAWFLDLTLHTGKPVVLTGAQRNVSEVGLGRQRAFARIFFFAGPSSPPRPPNLPFQSRCLAGGSK